MRAEGPRIRAASERVFADFLARRDLGEAADLESLCASHPELASELRHLDSDWRELGGVLEHLGFSDSMLGRASRPTLDLGERRAPVQVEEVEDSAARVAARIAARPHPYHRYRIAGEVGRGGMGAILEARDEDLRRDVVLKVARPGRNVDRFLEEAQIAAQLDHPGIVPVHELSLDDAGRLYFTMKLVKGRELRKVFDLVWQGQEGWTLARAVRALLKVCEAVAYAHDKRVLHRDLKPQNVMVGRFGEVLVMDWGLARVVGERETKGAAPDEPSFYTTRVRSDRAELSESDPESPFATMEGAAVGTPAYMSPEQAVGRRDDLTPATDVYGVGAMLYQLLTRRMPYIEPDEIVSSRVVLERVRSGGPRSVRELAPGAPPGLVAVCEKAMRRDPRQRHRSMLELADDLARWLDEPSPEGAAPRAGHAALLAALLAGAALGAGTLAAFAL